MHDERQAVMRVPLVVLRVWSAIPLHAFVSDGLVVHSVERGIMLFANSLVLRCIVLVTGQLQMHIQVVLILCFVFVHRKCLRYQT